jgi:anthranilate synthase component 1
MRAPFDIAADLDTPVSAFLKLAPFRPRFLLESVEGGERVARYSFLGLGDGMEVELRGDTLWVDGEPTPLEPGQKGLLDGLRSVLARAPRPGPLTPEVPFRGGLVGVTGFDVVRRFERLPVSTPRVEGHPDGAWFAPKTVLVLALRDEVVAALRGGVPYRRTGKHFSEPVPSMTKESFMEKVDTIKESIASGDVYQLVLSSAFCGTSDLDPFQVYRALRLLNPSPYLYFFQQGDLSVIGSSPEALVKLDGRQATLRPIAGTRRRGTDVEQDLALEKELLADPKELAEHVMLVDLARNDLGRVAVGGSVTVGPSATVERYSHVMHIVSGVNGVLRPDVDCFDLYASAFPAGTLTGAPKIRAMQIIDQLEPEGRGLYGGTVGYFGHDGTMDQAITIRTLVMSGQNYRYQAGAGVVADSVPLTEHNEILVKGAAIGAALALATEMD